MKRGIVDRILVCLILGAITNLIIVWHFPSPTRRLWRQAWKERHSRQQYVWTDPSTKQRWVILVKDGPVALSILFQKGSNEKHGDLLSISTAGAIRPFLPELLDDVHDLEVVRCARIDFVAAGWPMRAFHGISGKANDPEKRMASLYSRDMTWGRFPVLGTRQIVTKPIWSGIVANTFVLTFIWLITSPCIVYAMRLSFFVAPHAIWKRFHVREGCCPRCKYDLRAIDSARCPECGTPIAPRSIEDGS